MEKGQAIRGGKSRTILGRALRQTPRGFHGKCRVAVVEFKPWFCPTVIGKYFWNNISLSIRSKSPKKTFKKYLSVFSSHSISICC